MNTVEVISFSESDTVKRTLFFFLLEYQPQMISFQTAGITVVINAFDGKKRIEITGAEGSELLQYFPKSRCDIPKIQVSIKLNFGF